MRARWMVLALATGMVAAACGSADDGSGVVGAGDLVTAASAVDRNSGEVASLDAEATTTTAAEDAAVTGEEAILAFAECMREEGIAMRDPEIDPEGTLRLSIRSLVDGEIDRDALEAAREECLYLLEGIAQQFQLEDRSDLEDQLFAYASCMRDNGYDMPDPVYVEGAHVPGAGGGQGGPFGRLDRTDPDFVAANDACLPLFSDLYWGPGGGLGGGGGGGEE